MLNNERLDNIPHIINTLMSSFNKVRWANQKIPKINVIKETSIEFYAKYLFDNFKDGKFIHIIRDPRDNFSALKAGVNNYYSKHGEDDKTTLASMIYRYLNGMKLAELNKKRYGSSRYLIVRFEDIVSEAESTLNIICDFLKIDFNVSLLTPTFLGIPTPGNCFEGKKFNSISSANIARWKERITAQEAQIIEFHFAGEMEKYGYKPEYSSNDQIDAVSEFYKWMNYKYFYSDFFA